MILFKSALLHPIPSSRRHVVIRVDIPVPVDVIRVDFWMRILMKMVNTDCENNCTLRLSGGGVHRKFKIPIAAIEISVLAQSLIVRLLHFGGELTQQSDKCS